ncbi:MAG: aconitase family protein [Burkholderiaceae bacterium]
MQQDDDGKAFRAASWAHWQCGRVRYRIVDLPACVGPTRVSRMPYTVRILAENLARHSHIDVSAAQALQRLIERQPGMAAPPPLALPLRVSRVLLPDSSGLPLLADLAALRDELAGRGVDPALADTRIPVDLVVDHSLIAERAGRPDAIVFNMRREFERNAERYRFLRWAQQAFDGVGIVPPGVGIVHQVHLEALARVVDVTRERVPATPDEGEAALPIAHPEFVLGGDSHTPMVNALGVLGWGVGGVEAEAAMLGEAYMLPMPRIVGVRLCGKLPAGTTTTDLVLMLTERLRAVGVVGAIVEFCGELLAHLPVPERATLANMAPEYGATAAYFPIDDTVIAYLRATGRDADAVARVEAYARRNALFRNAAAPEPEFDTCIDIDVSAVTPCLAGPRRPQDRIGLAGVATDFRTRIAAPEADGGFAAPALPNNDAPGHGALAIAAITACTNTSNPAVMLAAGLLARNAVAAGLRVPAWVKTSLAPISRGRAPSRACRPADATRSTRLPCGGLRLHHLQRQVRTDRRDARASHRRRWTRGGRGRFVQPEFRGPDPPPGSRRLPGLATAGGRLRDRRPDHGGPVIRAVGHRPGRPARPSARHLARRRRDRRACAARHRSGPLSRQLRPCTRGNAGLA